MIDRKHKSENGDWQWFYKFAGIGMMHNFYTYEIFSTVMNSNPQIKRIVELGTSYGAMTVALGLEAIRKDIDIYSINIVDEITDETRRLFNTLKINYSLMDIMNPSSIEYLKKLFDRPCYLICDNGSKKDEFLTLVPHLPSRSVVSVHDWGTEFFPEHSNILKDSIIPFQEENWTKHNVQLATWIKK